MNIHCISSLFAALITFAGVWLVSRGFIESSSAGIWTRKAFQNRSRNPQQHAGRWRVFKSLPNLCLMPGKILPRGLLRLQLRLSAGPVTSSDSFLLQGCRELNYSEFPWHLLLLPENPSLSSYPPPSSYLVIYVPHSSQGHTCYMLLHEPYIQVYLVESVLLSLTVCLPACRNTVYDNVEPKFNLNTWTCV